MPHFLALTLTLVLSVGAVLVHYEALRLLTPSFSHGRGRRQMVSLILGLIAAHVLECGIFAGGYWLASLDPRLGGFSPAGRVSPLQYLYFSFETFTTQGVGDLFATGPLRLVASVEPLIGLILIGWSTSFTFVAMQRLGQLPDPARA